jgi:F0F1-type ATP synthase beta subunit
MGESNDTDNGRGTGPELVDDTRRLLLEFMSYDHFVELAVPVGDVVLGRLLDVVGTVRDRGPALPSDAPPAGIHNLPPALNEQTSTSAVFETGIKVIDLLPPLAQGGKAAMFGGAGVGKTVLVMELIHGASRNDEKAR